MSGPGPLRPARPTTRCLREDLCLAVPPVTVPLDEIDHPVPAKASEQFADEDGKHERIRSVDDQVLFKVGAVTARCGMAGRRSAVAGRGGSARGRLGR
ncbi:hypothetical protein OG802_12405 [Streptomyces sp. NBC_00704]|uniref:hypothetical protein n=1 Tax=Streptomyces sp. NBC_00704 TaxID=2975809 RepID=UPI002E376157|nr:hypothetical protein [Streptomyces sp. NBC_00704]